MTQIKSLGVLTSGGDSPGMNAAVRAIVRTALFNNVEIYGIIQGYEGMINGNIRKLSRFDVSGIIQKGGTILKTARSKEFRIPEGRAKAFQQLKHHNIDGVIVIGGDGSFRGASDFYNEYKIPFVGIPGTIDNDIFGTDYTIGYDTALNTVIECVDKIKDTASAHDRVFFVEVMGKDAGFLAINSGIASGAEGVLIPEIPNQVKACINQLKEQRDHSSSIFIVAEGDEEGGAMEVADKVRAALPHLDVRVTILGHIQRGGSPSCYDRVAASRMGMASVNAILAGRSGIMIGFQHEQIIEMDLSKTVKMHKDISSEMLELTKILI